MASPPFLFLYVCGPLLGSGAWMSREMKKLNHREDGNGLKHKKKR